MARTGWFMLIAPRSKEPYSYEGAVLIHDNPKELEWLFPGVRNEELSTFEVGRPLMRLKLHPDMQAVTWPLDPADFL